MARLLRAGSQLLRAGGAATFSAINPAGLLVWFDFADAATMYQDTAGNTPVTANGQAIGRVVSKVGSVALTQGTVGARPTYTTNAANGRSVARFDNDHLADTAFVMDLRARTIFIVVRENVAVDGAGLLVVRPAAGNDYDRTDGMTITAGDGTQLIGIAGSTGVSYLLLVAGTGAMPLGIYCERMTSTAGRVYANGGAAAATDTTFTPFAAASGGGLLLGKRFTAGQISNIEMLRGDICEVLIYNSELSAANTNTVGAYLATKWGPTWTAIS